MQNCQKSDCFLQIGAKFSKNRELTQKGNCYRSTLIKWFVMLPETYNFCSLDLRGKPGPDGERTLNGVSEERVLEWGKGGGGSIL